MFKKKTPFYLLSWLFVYVGKKRRMRLAILYFAVERTLIYNVFFFFFL